MSIALDLTPKNFQVLEERLVAPQAPGFISNEIENYKHLAPHGARKMAEELVGVTVGAMVTRLAAPQCGEALPTGSSTFDFGGCASGPTTAKAYPP
jgi:hypothetical protein